MVDRAEGFFHDAGTSRIVPAVANRGRSAGSVSDLSLQVGPPPDCTAERL